MDRLDCYDAVYAASEGDNRLLESNSSISRLVSLKPRQVLLAEQKQQEKKHQLGLTMAKKQAKEQLNQKTGVPENDCNLALLHLVVKYISNKGFSKTLKKLLKEAQVEDDAWKANSFDLEDMYYRYLTNCGNGGTNTSSLKEQEESVRTMLKDADGDKDAPSDSINKKKKKKNDDNAKSSVSEVNTDNSTELKDKKKKKKNTAGEEDASLNDDGKKMKKINEENDNNAKSSVLEVKKDDSMMELTQKKKKSKSKLMSESRDENGTVEEKLVHKGEEAAEILLDHNKTDPKGKKKKKKVSVSEKLSDNGVDVFGKEQSQDNLDNGTDKKSKKRKRSASDESKDNLAKGVVSEESKKRKTEDPEEAEVNKQQAEVKTVHGGDADVDGETREDNGDGSQFKSPMASIKQLEDSEKGNLMNHGVGRSSKKKSETKQHNGSAQPNSVNAFQRVKVDAVEFADERLQDNSYWAKDGAENGYGAKAQEILGQVKGRGFRHEKTKKKRGSYRGGQIDLQSHSVKFNYSDDE